MGLTPRLQILDSVGYVKSAQHSNVSSSGNSSSTQQPHSYKDAEPGKILEILRVRNRFGMEKGDPHWSGGFRDLAFKVKVGFKVLPVDVLSNKAFRTVTALHECDCRSPQLERRNLCQCMTSCLHAAHPMQWASCHLILSVLQESMGQLLRQNFRLRAADSPPSELRGQACDARPIFCDISSQGDAALEGFELLGGNRKNQSHGIERKKQP